MWPRTVTLYMSIPYAMTDRVDAPGGEIGHHSGQRLEVALACDQRIELRVLEQREREGHPPTCVPSRAPQKRHAAHLRRLEREPLRVKRRAEPHRDDLIAVPAHLHDRRFEAGDSQRELKPGPGNARVDHEIRVR